MHWKELWHAFGRYGDVVDAFIAIKISRGWKRFGFVRFVRRLDAVRAMSRLNGFYLYGFRISVAFAKFNGRSKYWRKVRSRGNLETVQTVTKDNIRSKEKVDVEGKSTGEASKPIEMKNIRILGHVEEEELWKLKQCLVGTTPSVCSVKSIVDRLQSWGLGEIKIQRLGELSGVPLHCWNHKTFRKVAKVWGTFEALGVNASHTKDCERVTMLMTTKLVTRINETLQWNKERNQKNNSNYQSRSGESESSSEFVSKSASERTVKSKSPVMVEAKNVIRMGKVQNKACWQPIEEYDRAVGKPELSSSGLNATPLIAVEPTFNNEVVFGGNKSMLNNK
ncbi:hypothetical protein V6N13_122071 [Hibiscus sabdariffa]